MCFDHYDDCAPDFYTDQRVKARKEHRCYECQQTICRGETYRRIVGKWDGSLQTLATCETCERAREIVREHEEAEGCHGDEAECPVGGLKDYLRDVGVSCEDDDFDLTPEVLALHGSLALCLALQRLQARAEEEAA